MLKPAGMTITTRENSVVKAVANQSTTAHVLGDLILPTIPTRPAQPLINTGGESVVKAEVDASHNVSAAGDIVNQKIVHSTHRETHVHRRESAIGAFGKTFNRVLYPHKDEEEKIHRECEQASDSDSALFAFISKQISAINSLSVLEAFHDKLTPARVSAATYGLEIVEHRNAKRPEVLARVERLRGKLTLVASAHKRKPLMVFGGLFSALGVCVIVLILLAILYR